MIDPTETGITPWMYRLNPRVFAGLAGLGLVLACGDGSAPSHEWPDDDTNTGATATGASSGNPSTPNGNAGTNNPSGGAQNGTGGAQNTAGNAPGGSGNVAGTTSAGGSTGALREYWIASNGADTNPGTEAAPLLTLAAAIKKSRPGVTFWLKPGTYAAQATLDVIFGYSGTEAMPVTLKAAPGGRPVLDFSSQPEGNDDFRGINLLANYWHIQGIEVMKAADNCIAIAGSHNVIEDVIVHECGDTGIQITAPSSQATDDTRAAENTIINCDSWGNLDTATGGENADGFAAKLRIGPGNLFQGCRAWNNADDGWDLFASDDVVSIKDSWAFSNGKPLGGSNPQGDGNGFKLGGEPKNAGEGGAVHLVSGSFAFENKSCGFVRNNNPETPKLTSCGAKDNKTAYCSLTVSSEKTMSMSASAARTAARAANGALPPMQ